VNYKTAKEVKKIASKEEIQMAQAVHYYQLMTIKARNEKAGIKVLGLQNAINLAKAQMTEPDIAWVEKQVAENED